MPAFWQKICCCFSSAAGSFSFDDEQGTSQHGCTFCDTFDFVIYLVLLIFFFGLDKHFASDSDTNLNLDTNGFTYSNGTINSANSLTQNLASFMGFSKPKGKHPREVVKGLKVGLARLDAAQAAGKDAKVLSKLSTDLAKPVTALKTFVLQSEDDVIRGDYEIQMILTKSVYDDGLLSVLVCEIEKLPFESRKDAVIVFNSLIRRQIPINKPIIAEFIRDSQPELLGILLKGYDKPENTLNYGLMLRECIKYDFLADIILSSPDFDRLFDYIQLPTFDVSSDAFATFKDLMTRHKHILVPYLTENYDRVFKRLNTLLVSDNYVTRRQSLKLLGELLHDRKNYDIMLRYVSEVENLKLLMNQLRDKSEKIQYEAFQVFKIFIANPNKPKQIYDILCKNRDKILHFLENFTGGKDDRGLIEDKMFLIEKLQQLPQYTSSHSHGQSHVPAASVSDSVPMAPPDGLKPRKSTESLKDNTSFFSVSASSLSRRGSNSSQEQLNSESK